MQGKYKVEKTLSRQLIEKSRRDLAY